LSLREGPPSLNTMGYHLLHKNLPADFIPLIFGLFEVADLHPFSFCLPFRYRLPKQISLTFS
jgi:hypothetical protein